VGAADPVKAAAVADPVRAAVAVARKVKAAAAADPVKADAAVPSGRASPKSASAASCKRTS